MNDIEKRINVLEDNQEKLLLLIKTNLELIESIHKRERLQSMVVTLLAISVILLNLKPVIQQLLGN